MKKQYWVLIEPDNDEYAWFFLTKTGRCEYKNTTDKSSSWEKMPDVEMIFNLMSHKHVPYTYHFYIVEGIVKGRSFDLDVVSEGAINKNYEMEVADYEVS